MIPRPIAKRLDGFRGAFILILSGPWLAVGLSYIFISTPTRSKAFSYLPEFLNENELGWVWVIAGIVMLVCAYYGRQDPRFTSTGFRVAVVPPALWSCLFFMVWLTGVLPTAIVYVVMYGTFACLIAFCAGWPNPHQRSRDAPGGY